jgi:hypothetical protein
VRCVRSVDAVFNSEAVKRVLGETRTANVLGMACNAALLLQLAEHAGRFGYRLRVGSPTLFPGRWRATDAVSDLVLYLQTSGGITQISGQWHDFTVADQTVYALHCVKNYATCRALLATHPAAAVFRYVRGNTDEQIQEFYNLVTDIRWFLRPERPSRTSRLEAYLGITPGNAKHFLAPVTPGDLHTARFIRVASLWFRGRDIPAETVFLRCFREDATARTLLRQTQRFLSLVRLIWLGSCVTEYANSFQPARFFSSTVDTEEFTRSLQS